MLAPRRRVEAAMEMSEDRDLWDVDPEFDEPAAENDEELLADLEDDWEDEEAYGSDE